MRKAYSLKTQQFAEFADLVIDHIDNYVVPQYGDLPDEQIKNMTKKDIQFQIDKYSRRITKNSRPGEEARDAIKIAHYACYLYNLIMKGVCG